MERSSGVGGWPAAAVRRSGNPVWQDDAVLCARYSASSGVELAGSKEALQALASRLGNGLIGAVPLDERQLGPYDQALARIALRNDGRMLRISVEDDTLVVSGDREALGMLSQNLSFFVNDSDDPADPPAH